MALPEGETRDHRRAGRPLPAGRLAAKPLRQRPGGPGPLPLERAAAAAAQALAAEHRHPCAGAGRTDRRRRARDGLAPALSRGRAAARLRPARLARRGRQKRGARRVAGRRLPPARFRPARRARERRRPRRLARPGLGAGLPRRLSRLPRRARSGGTVHLPDRAARSRRARPARPLPRACAWSCSATARPARRSRRCAPTGRASPIATDTCPSSIARPPRATAQGPASGADFLDRFLGLFESVLTPLEDQVAASWRLTAPATAPAEALDWLAGWIGLLARARPRRASAPPHDPPGDRALPPARHARRPRRHARHRHRRRRAARRPRDRRAVPPAPHARHDPRRRPRRRGRSADPRRRGQRQLVPRPHLPSRRRRAARVPGAVPPLGDRNDATRQPRSRRCWTASPTARPCWCIAKSTRICCA